jgi:uncharacterized phage protein (predicted DNA packaging)
MTEKITLEEAKLQCRVDSDYEDTLIQAYIDASLEACQKHIGKRFDDGMPFNPALKVGCLMYVAFLYDSRAMVSAAEMYEVPLAIASLWSVYRDVGIY